MGMGMDACPLPRIFSILDQKMSTLGAFLALFFYSSAIWFKRKNCAFRLVYFAPALKGRVPLELGMDARNKNN